MKLEHQIRERLETAVAEKTFPGAVAAVLFRNGTRVMVEAGRFTYEDTSSQVTPDTVYDVASITKTIPVGLIALHLIERGKLRLDDSIVHYVPEIRIPNAGKGLIRHLLTYTYVLQKNADTDFTYERSSAKDIFDFLFTRPFAFLPGTQHQYSNAPTNILGIILERISGKKLYVLAQELILGPLAMTRSTFHPSDPKTIPPTEITSWRGEIQGVVHDETAFILGREGYDSGCAGLFSPVGDLLSAAEMLLRGGEFNGNRMFRPETIELMTTNALAGIGAWSGIGWELNNPKFMGSFANEHTIGKTGFTGTSIVIDIVRGVAVVLLSNRTYPARTEAKAISTVRRDVADLAFGAL